MDFDYEQHMRFVQLYNSAVAAQELDAKRRQARRLNRYNSFDLLPMEYDRVRYPLPLRRAGSSGKLDLRRLSVNRTSSESGYSSNREFYRGRSLERPRLSKRESSLSDTYEGYPQVRRVSVVRKGDDRPPTPPIIKRKSSSMTSSRSSVSPGQSVRFSTVEDIDQGAPWNGRYKPRASISSDRDSHISAHSMNGVDAVYYQGRRSSSASRSHHRRSSSSGRRDSVSSRRTSVSSRRSSRSSRRGSVAPDSRRQSMTSGRASFSYAPNMEFVNPHGVEGAEIMRQLSRGGGGLKEWERSTIMSRRSSRSSRRDSRDSRRGSTSSRRRSSVGYTSSNSSDSDSDSDSGSDSSSSYDSSSGSNSSGSDSGSGSDSDSEGEESEGEKRKSSSRKTSTAKTTQKNVVVGEGVVNANANGVSASPMNGGMAFAMDGGNNRYYQMEEDNSSAFCVIL